MPELPITDHALKCWAGVYTKSPRESKWFHEATEARIKAEVFAREQAEAKLAALPADWFKDSSLATWFPLTAVRLARVEAELDAALRECEQIRQSSRARVDALERLNDSERIHAEVAKNKQLRLAIGGLIAAMEIQERREAETFHVSKDVARGIWDRAKAFANESIKDAV